MNKGKNCFFAILVFGLTMAVFNGMSVVLAVSASIGGGIIQGANATSTAITLKWAKLKGINGYYIYRSASRDSGYTRLARLSENAVSYRVTGLGAEKTYIRVVPYKLVNGKAVTLPHEITTLSR